MMGMAPALLLLAVLSGTPAFEQCLMAQDAASAAPDCETVAADESIDRSTRTSALEALARLRIAAGDYDGAVTSAAAALDIRADAAEALYLRALAHFYAARDNDTMRDTDRLLDAMQDANAGWNGEARVHALRSFVLEQHQAHDELMYELQVLDRLDPTGRREAGLDAGGLVNRGQLYLSGGNGGIARSNMELAVAVDPEHPEANLELARLLTAGDHSDAVKHAAIYAAAHPGDAAGGEAMGRALLALRDPREARTHLDRFVFEHRGLPVAHALRAEAFFRLGETERALADLDIALTAENRVEWLFLRGLTRFYDERYDEARADFAQAAETPGGSDIHRFWQMFAARRAGDHADATAIRESIDTAHWPGILLRRMTGELTHDQVTSRDAIGGADLTMAHICAAYFYRGMWDAVHSRPEAAERNLGTAQSECYGIHMEQQAARFELAGPRPRQEPSDTAPRPAPRTGPALPVDAPKWSEL